MPRSALVLALALMLCSYPALAQQDAEDTPDVNGFAVQVNLSAALHVEDGTVQLPSELMGRLADEEALYQLEVTTAQRATATRLRAQFAFDSMAAFTAWYESPPTRALFELIEEESRMPVELAVSMRRR